MNLNQNSIHARLYRFFYDTEKMPANLCPYFWKLVLCVVWLIPYCIFTLPYYITVRLTNDPEMRWAERQLMGIVIYMMLVLAGVIIVAQYHIFAYWLGAYSYNRNLATFGGICWVFVGTILLIRLIRYVIRSLNDKPHKRTEPRQYIVVEFIRSKYNKYCPQIKWKS